MRGDSIAIEETIGREKLHVYDLRSFDHGKNWFAVQSNGGEVKILGPADQIFPDLVRVLDEWDAVLKGIKL